MIDGVDEEEDRSCGTSSWSLHTDHWSLRAEEGGGNDVTASTTTKMTSGRGVMMTADAIAPPMQTRTKTACHRRRTGFRRSDFWNKKHAGGIPPPPFVGPNNDDRSRQRTGDDEKESRRWMKLREDRSGRSTTAVGCGKSGCWMAR